MPVPLPGPEVRSDEELFPCVPVSVQNVFDHRASFLGLESGMLRLHPKLSQKAGYVAKLGGCLIDM